MPYLEIQNLTKYFVEGVPGNSALDGVNLTLEAGESLAICGASGAGKSTLLNLIGGLERPNAGRVIIDGHDLSTLSETEEAAFRSKSLGFVFQFHHLLADFTILENVMMPLLIQGRSQAEAKVAGLAILKRVGLSGLEARFPRELSGGEQQRAAIARAVIHQPALILADEPTGNLDDANGMVVFDLLCELNHVLRATLIVVTHHDSFAEKLGKIMRLEAGKIKSLTQNNPPANV
jgi:lipoprotein-releasing system ATP-binding protein